MSWQVPPAAAVRQTLIATGTEVRSRKTVTVYRDVQGILIHPSTVIVPEHMDPWAGNEAGVYRSPVPILGQAVAHGPVILVWDEVKKDARHPERGHNVVYHEFAHEIDCLDGLADGTPPIHDHQEFERWVRVCTREFEELRRRSAKGKRTLLDAYAGTNPAEFFAVATEVFFDKPVAMRRKHPELYDVLRAFYRQDPAEREMRAKRR